MEYDCCPFCGKMKWGYRKTGRWGDITIERFICFECDRASFKEANKEEKSMEIEREIEKRFTYHSPKEGQPERYTSIREKAKQFAYLIAAECPESRERSIAFTKLDEAVMWANASIARND